MKLSVVLATRNEEKNIDRCLRSVRPIADEIIIFDESSTDDTVKIAKKFGAKVFETDHNDNFHVTKQKAIDKANGEWILQMDADEVVTPALAKEIEQVINSGNKELLSRVVPFSSINHQSLAISHNQLKLFIRHQHLIERRDGKIGKVTGGVVAFFVPRVNMFFGKPLVHGGVYPDGVIRLIKRGKARLPAKSVHEQMEIDGEVGWLFNYMEHYDSPTFERYLWRNNRYTDLIAKDLASQNTSTNVFTLLHYSVNRPLFTFLNLYIRHKAFLDGFPGFVWSLFSALRFPISYFKYWQSVKK